jgi:hypothetical protein
MKKRRMVVDREEGLNEAWVDGVAIKVETSSVHGKLETDMI